MKIASKLFQKGHNLRRAVACNNNKGKKKPGLSLFTCIRLSKVISSTCVYFLRTCFSKVERICVGLHPVDRGAGTALAQF